MLWGAAAVDVQVAGIDPVVGRQLFKDPRSDISSSKIDNECLTKNGDELQDYLGKQIMGIFTCTPTT